jgi:hypothetical protein
VVVRAGIVVVWGPVLFCAYELTILGIEWTE